jgi:hypothetical protein
MDGRLEAPRPDYGGACLTEVVPTILDRKARAASGSLPSWCPESLAEADQVVLLVLDGLGYGQLRERAMLAPALSSLEGSSITSVAPTTTATALTSIVSGLVPAAHGLLGYRLIADGAVLNVLRWTIDGADARKRVPPASLQHEAAFRGSHPPVISRAEFAGTGFTEAHERGGRLVGWRMPSAIPVEISRALVRGEPFIYAYYDGIDKTAHEYGLGEYYAAELRATDRLVADILEVLPHRAALAVTADHGQVEVPTPAITLDATIVEMTERLSGEGRFRWLHARPGATDAVAEACEDLYGDVAWVATCDELCELGYFGGPLAPEFRERLGNVALLAREPVAFADPADDGELRLVARHGSLTLAELAVPFLVGAR